MSLGLEILAPDSVVLRTRVRKLQAADASGRFGIWPHHEAFLTLLVPSVLVFQEESGQERYAAADGGVLLLEADQISIVTRDAVVADRLDAVADAAAAMLEARRREEASARGDFAELQAALLRELRQAEERS